MDLVAMMAMLLPMAAGSHDGWVHPAGLIDCATLSEVRHKRDTQDWARKILYGLDQGVQMGLSRCGSSCSVHVRPPCNHERWGSCYFKEEEGRHQEIKGQTASFQSSLGRGVNPHLAHAR